MCFDEPRSTDCLLSASVAKVEAFASCELPSLLQAEVIEASGGLGCDFKQ
jgi:hypothetical protein